MKTEGFTLIDVLVGTVIVLIVFLGIFGAYQLGLKVVGLSKAKITATALANQKIEMARNLAYDDVGTIGGIPPGTILETETITRNNIDYTVKTTVVYIDDPFDGLAPADTLPSDYKRVRVKVSWLGRFGGEVILITDIAPKGIETEEGGGTLYISVFNASGIGVAQADIHLVNSSVDPAIDVWYQTNDNGEFVIPGAPTSTEAYQITVSKTGYSSERTYGRDEVANPSKPQASVYEGQLTEISFSVDRLSTFSIDTLSPGGTGSFADSFLDESKIAEKLDIAVSGGEVNLAKTPGVYFTGGTTDADLCSFPGIDGDCGQSFTMGEQSREISQLQLFIKNATTDPSDIYLQIREDSTIGKVIATSTQIDSGTLPDILGWITFTLENPVTLAANTQYFLRLRSTPDSTDPWAGAEGYIYWGYIHSDTAPPAYGLGDAWRYIGRNNNPDDPGQQLGPVDQYDFSFKIYDDEYKDAGYLISQTIAPTDLTQWDKFSFTDFEPSRTQINYQILYASGTDWFLIPDEDLPGNSTGFGVSPIDLSGLTTTTYSQLRLKGNLSTSDSTISPTLYDWQLTWLTSTPTPIPNVTFKLEGAKIIGTDLEDNPVYKYSQEQTTNGAGHIDITALEWDSYSFYIDKETTGLDLISTDPEQPVSLLPDSLEEVDLYLKAENTLSVTVKDANTLNPIFAVSVRLYNAGLGYDKTLPTGEEGRAFFIPLEAATYNLEITASGYQDYADQVSVSGTTTKTVNLFSLP